ncbi:hypothetical protein Q9K01_03760 [Qipengyuania sp. DY56-A-20]|uniref:Uncharacterized protein n=1 Tax=Qipengyuania benthica TaxID=3067651 RepID=A0ABT9H619_9SPHN|nr:hypothetical protein [Qipengyuania sp. DY56-A-20]MDP4538736.1 hypothetical protein [Qipengyuania sp. DY56-A-20]
MAKPTHLTDMASDRIDDAVESVSGERDTVPGPSTNPSTNLIINDILLRSVGRLSRITVEKAVLGRKYGSQFAKDAVENRSLLHTMAAYGVTKVATRSLPGAAIVSTGLVLKVLFDRSQSRRKSRRTGERMLRKQADYD